MPSDRQREHRNKWDAAHMTVLGCKVRKERADEFRTACKEVGTTPNAVFLEAITAFLEKHRKSVN